LIEDNKDDVVLVKHAFGESTNYAFQIEHAIRLSRAIELLQEFSFDVILCDLTLPDSTGIETFHDLLAAASDVPIVILSGNQNDAVAVEAIEQGAQDYIVKDGFNSELLVRTLRYAITRHRLTAELQTSEQRLRMMAEQLPAMLWTTDADLRITSLRGRELATMNLNAEQFVGAELSELFPSRTPSFEHPSLMMHRNALQGESSSSDLHWHGRWYHAHVQPLDNEHSMPVGAIGVALDVTDVRKLRRDVEAAHSVQEHLLPIAAPIVPGFDIAGQCYPAERCSGDFFDYIPLQDDRIAIVLADVSGHGFGPAIMAATIRSYLRTAAVLGNHVHEMLALGNRLLAGDSGTNPFASVFCVSLDSRSRTIEYASAGHPAYLIRQGGDVEVLESASVPIGVLDDEVFPLSKPIRLHRNDILLVASDAVFETRRDHSSFFGIERAMDVIRTFSDQPAREIVAQLYAATCDFASAELDDDVTAVIIKAERAPN
jgi:DNA-binding response OmpR family regulator